MTLSLRHALWIALGTALMLVTGCSGPSVATRPGMPAGFPNHTASQIHGNIAAPSDTLHAFRADARVSVQSPVRDGSFNANVRQNRSDSLWMRFSLFGIEGGRMLVTPDSFYFYDTRKNRLTVGTTAGAEDYLPAPVASGQIFENMLGLVAPDPAVNWTVESDSTLYYLTSPDGRQEITIDPATWRVLRMVTRTADGSIAEERRFSNFESVNGILIARRVLFRRPPDDVLAVLTYSSITLNPTDLSFDLNVRDSARRVSGR